MRKASIAADLCDDPRHSVAVGRTADVTHGVIDVEFDMFQSWSESQLIPNGGESSQEIIP